ncbi:hypothetical protein WJX81_005645 [Elliptochloris bilobata]
MFNDEGVLLKVTQHFFQKGLIVLAFWFGRRQVQRFTKKQPSKKSCEEVFFRVIRDPNHDFKPANPLWLVEAAEWATSGVPPEHQPPECPLLTKFKEDVHERGFHVEPGRAARDALFMLDPEMAYLNHGSFGAAFRLAAEVQAWYQAQIEREPVHYFEGMQLAAISMAKAELSRFICARPRDVVAVSNATSAAAVVMASVPLGPGDFLLCTTMTYAAVANALARTAERAGAGLIVVELDLYTLLAGDGAIAARFRAALAAVPRGRVRLAVVDHIGSNPPIEFPLPAIIAACRAAGAKVLVDGAHALGAVPLDVPALGADYYTSNCHKWLCTPKAAAFLWAAPAEQAVLVPRVTSHGYRVGFQGEFLWAGTTDETAWL